MGIVERMIRIGFTYGLIVLTMSLSAPSQLVLLLPRVAIYPILTGMFGWDPVYETAGRIFNSCVLYLDKLKSRNGAVKNAWKVVH